MDFLFQVTVFLHFPTFFDKKFSTMLTFSNVEKLRCQILFFSFYGRFSLQNFIGKKICNSFHLLTFEYMRSNFYETVAK